MVKNRRLEVKSENLWWHFINLPITDASMDNHWLKWKLTLNVTLYNHRRSYIIFLRFNYTTSILSFALSQEAKYLLRREIKFSTDCKKIKGIFWDVIKTDNKLFVSMFSLAFYQLDHFSCIICTLVSECINLCPSSPRVCPLWQCPHFKIGVFINN